MSRVGGHRFVKFGAALRRDEREYPHRSRLVMKAEMESVGEERLEHPALIVYAHRS